MGSQDRTPKRRVEIPAPAPAEGYFAKVLQATVSSGSYSWVLQATAIVGSEPRLQRCLLDVQRRHQRVGRQQRHHAGGTHAPRRYRRARRPSAIEEEG